MFYSQFIIPRCMVWHPVEDNMHPHLMCFVKERFKIVEIPEFRVHIHIVSDRIITSQFSFLVYNSNRVCWHKPEYVHPKGFQPWKMSSKCDKRSLIGVLPDVYFIKYLIFRPFRMYNSGNKRF